MGRRVWFHEIFGFLFKDKPALIGKSLAQFSGAPQEKEEEASSPKRSGVRLKIGMRGSAQH
jgi:anaerobic magnesium-protoporphyrin IX monomethyl ester cyclase